MISQFHNLAWASAQLVQSHRARISERPTRAEEGMSDDVECEPDCRGEEHGGDHGQEVPDDEQSLLVAPANGKPLVADGRSATPPRG